MALPDIHIRNRSRLWFILVMLGHTLLISTQVNSQAGVSVARHALNAAVVESQRATWTVVGGLRDAWSAYVALRGQHDENARLSQENADLKVRLQQERVLARGAEQLRALLDLKTHLGWSTTGAEVIAGSTSPEFKAVTIDKGTDAAIRPDMAVIATAGVVGRVVEPSARAASVQLLVDQNAAASVMVARSGAQGIVLGSGSGVLHLEYLSAIADVQEGDIIVTAGLDGIYPKGLTVGRVTAVERAGVAIRRATVMPAVDFSSLQTVLVVMTPPPRPEDQAR